MQNLIILKARGWQSVNLQTLRLKLLFVLALGVLPLGLQGQSAPEDPNSAKELQPAASNKKLPYNQDSFNQILFLIDQQQLATAEQQLKRVDKSPAKPELEQQFDYLGLQISCLQAQLENCASQARQFLQNYFGGVLSVKAFYWLNWSLDQLQQPLEMVELVDQSMWEELSELEIMTLESLLLKQALQRQDDAVARNYLQTQKPLFINVAKQYLSDVQYKNQLGLFFEMGMPAELYWEATFKGIELDLQNGQTEQALKDLQALYEQDLPAAVLARIAALETRLQQALQTKAYRIGVLLPFSYPKYKALVRQVVEGLDLALKDFSNQNVPIELVFKDTGFDAKTTQRALVELVEKDQVIAVLGPLGKETSRVAGNTAAAYRVPLISFSLTENIGQNNPYLFRFQRDNLAEAKAIGMYATDYLHARRFAIIHWDQPATKKRVQVFSAAVKSRGAEVVGVEKINAKTKDLRPIFRRLTRNVVYLGNNEKNKSVSNTRAKIDAVYLAIPLSKIPAILSFIRAYNAGHAWILGESELNNSRSFVLQSPAKIRFADVYQTSHTANYQALMEKHWKHFNSLKNYQAPSTYTLFAYQGLDLLSQLLQLNAVSHGEAMQQQLKTLDNFALSNGDVVSTSRSGDIQKPLYILSLHSSQSVNSFILGSP